MNHSEGPRKVQLAYGVTRFASTTGLKGDSSGGTDLTALLRHAYPAYFVPQSLQQDEYPHMMSYGQQQVQQ